MLCAGIVIAASACATKGFVREQVGATETRLGQRVDTQDTKFTQRLDTTETQVRDTASRTTANTQALERVDGRVAEVGGVANDAKALATTAKTQAETVANSLKETEAQLSSKIANRNNYRTLETTAIYFDFNKASLKDEGINHLEELAQALKADPNAVVELQGFADPRGADRYNFQLTRERVDAVVRYLVERHDIPLRRIHAVGMGKVGAKGAGGKMTRDEFAKSRRVDIRLLAPQS
jgi:outer membrane protein OmpA-like peptidoglycan-associated protein